MSALRIAGRAFALSVLLGSASFAAEEPVGVPVRIWGTGTAVSQRYGDPAVLEFATTFLESAPGAGDGAYSSWGSYSGAGAGGFGVPQKTVRAEPGKRYVIDIIGDYISYFSLSASAPAGYKVEFDGVIRKRIDASGIGPFYYSSVAFRLVEQRAGFTERAGVATQIDENKPHWSVALGYLKSGGSAGALAIIDAGTGSGWAPIFTPSTLQYEGPAAEIQVYRVSNAIRQVLANQAAVDVVTINSTTYELRFYNPGQVVGSTFPRTFTGDPYVVYEVTQGSTSTTLKITSKTRNVTSTTGSFSIVRTAVTTLARTGSWPTFDWTRNDWNTSGQTQVVEQFSDGSGTASARVENLEIRPGGSTTEAISVQRNYSLYGWGEQLASEIIGTSNTITTTRDYYTTSSEPGRYGFLKSITETGGNWTAYDYWDSGTAGAKTGQIKYKFRPWLGSPSTVSFTTTSGEVTYYEYVADPWGADTRPSLVETKVNNVLTAKSTTAYSDVSGTTNGMYLVEAVRNDYSATSAYLTTTTRYYKENTSDAFYRNQIHSVVQPGNLKTSFLRQRGTWSGGTFTKSANGGTADGTASRIAIISGTTATGTLRQTEDSYDIDDLYLVTGQSTMEVTIRDASALVARTESHVWTGSAWALIGWQNNTYTYAGQLLQTTSSNGAVRDWSWNGEQLSSATDEAGVVVSYSLYDHAGRVKEVAKVDGPTTEFTYNAAGKVTEEKLKRTGTSETITVARAFDDAGRQTSETPPGLSATTFGYNPSARTQTTTNPDGGTRIETYLLDGRLEKITGTAIVEQFYDYAIESDGRRRTQVNIATSTSNRWAKTWTDWLGRTIHEDVPTWNGGTGTRAHTYDTAGRLLKTTQPGLAPTLRTYDSMGNLASEGLDINGTADSLDAASDDRIRLYSTTIYENGTGVWWLKQTESTYPISMNGTTLKELGRTETKLTSLATNRLSHVELFDIYGNKTVSYTEVNRGTKTVFGYVDPPDSDVLAYKKTVNGLLTQTKDTAAVTTNFTYDTLGRPSTSTNPRTNAATTTLYITNSARVTSVWIPGTPNNIMQVQYDYDSMGRVWRQKDTFDKYAYTSYTIRGEVYRQWGDTATPVEFSYDSYGQQSKMKTFRGGTGWNGSTWPTSPGDPDFTKWEYDEGTGLLKYKYDAANLNSSGEPITNPKRVAYTYNSAGQIKTRTWARGSLTTYYYFGEGGGEAVTGELRKVDYNDTGMIDLDYTYNRVGAIASVTDYAGARTFTYDLNGTLELQREDLPSYFNSRRLTYEYETSTSGALGRPTGFKLGTSANPALEQTVTFGYLGDGRLNSVTGGGETFAYGYTANSHLIASTTVSALNYTDTRTYDTKNDWLDVRETTWGSGTPVTKAKFAYTQDNIGRVMQITRTGEMFNHYGTDSTKGLKTTFGYNDRSELTSEITTDLASTPVNVNGRQDAYAYDKMGNRTSVTKIRPTGDPGGDITFNYSPSGFEINNLNQYRRRTVPGVYDLAAISSASSVSVSGTTSGTMAKQGEFFFRGHPLDNNSSPVFDELTLTPNGGSGVTHDAFLPAKDEAFTYDDDGNLTSDGRWNYYYDAENRLKTMDTTTAAAAAGVPRQWINTAFDYLGRRIVKQSLSGWNGSSYTVTDFYGRFVYNGWNIVADINPTTGSLKKSFFWGMDIAGPGQRAGGIGALLMIKDGDNKFVPAYDGMGNLHALMTTAAVEFGEDEEDQYAAGDIVAAYEYDAFGQTIRESGPYAASNPFRFSTKYTDNDTGLVYFGLRYYSPSLGRFINRDPIGESGGLNLYGYCGNNATNSWDYLGMLTPYEEYLASGNGSEKMDRSPKPQQHKGNGIDRDLEAAGGPGSMMYVDPVSSFMARVGVLQAAINYEGAMWAWAMGEAHRINEEAATSASSQQSTAVDPAAASDRAKLAAAQERLNSGEEVTVRGAGGGEMKFSPGMLIQVNATGGVFAYDVLANVVAFASYDSGNTYRRGDLNDVQKGNLTRSVIELRSYGGSLGRALANEVIAGKVAVEHFSGVTPSRTGLNLLSLDLDVPSLYSNAARANDARRRGMTVNKLNRQVGFNPGVILGHELGHAVLKLSDPMNVTLVENPIRSAMGIELRTRYVRFAVPDAVEIPKPIRDRVATYGGGG